MPSRTPLHAQEEHPQSPPTSTDGETFDHNSAPLKTPPVVITQSSVFSPEPIPGVEMRATEFSRHSLEVSGSRASSSVPSMVPEDDPLRSSVQLGDGGAVLCQGWLDKEPPRSGINSILNLGAADWKRRYFALVAMYVDDAMRGSLGGTTTERRKYWRLQRCAVLVWFDAKDHFDDWSALLKQEQQTRQRASMTTDNDGYDSVRVLPATLDVGPELGGVVGVLELPHVAGSVHLSSCADPIRECLRLDVRDTKYRVMDIDSVSGQRTYRLGASNSEDFETWLRTLNRELSLVKQRIHHHHHSHGPRSSDHRQNVVSHLRRGAKEERLPNKWKQSVTFPLHHPIFVLGQLFSLAYLFALVWLLNPHLKPCAQETIIDEHGFCQLADGELDWDGDCVPWSDQRSRLGAWRSWVSELEGTLFDSRVHFEGDNATCFKVPSAMEMVVFWFFVVLECISVTSNCFAGVMCWHQVRRGARQLNELSPPFPKEFWPSVDILVCHYSEPCEESVDTLKACLELEYPPNKLHIHIIDDGYLKSDFSRTRKKKGAHWPEARLNSSGIEKTGDLRVAVAKFMEEVGLKDGDLSSTPPPVRTTECIPDPSSRERVVARVDCAAGYICDEYKVPGLPTVSYVARLKPEVHHAKAGNINNALYNTGSAVGRYCVIFDNDMQPHPKFLTSCLPLFFEPQDNDGETSSSPYSDDVSVNRFAFVQTPQYFKNNELMLAAGGDPLAHENTTFMGAGLPGMDGFDSCMFVGTNCLWRRLALDSIGGIQYGTVSEDFWTGRHAHNRGWDSAYLRKDYIGFEGEHRFRLAEGEVPPTVAAALAQRKRWHKGSVELFLGVDNQVDPLWEKPSEAANVRLGPTPWKAKCFRELQWTFARMSWLTGLPAIFYPLLLVYALFARTLWFYLNPLPTFLFMCPRLFLSSFVIYLGAYFIDHEHLLNDETEYFSYAWIRLQGTCEAFYSKWTGKPSAWGNTGGIGRGSSDELPNLILISVLTVGLIFSVYAFLFVDQTDDIASFIPVWGFTCITLRMLWPIVRASIQEFFGWSYKSLNMGQLTHSLVPALLMAVAVLTSQRKEVTLAQQAGGASS